MHCVICAVSCRVVVMLCHVLCRVVWSCVVSCRVVVMLCRAVLWLCCVCPITTGKNQRYNRNRHFLIACHARSCGSNNLLGWMCLNVCLPRSYARFSEPPGTSCRAILATSLGTRAGYRSSVIQIICLATCCEYVQQEAPIADSLQRKRTQIHFVWWPLTNIV